MPSASLVPFQLIRGNTIEVCGESVLQELFALAGLEEPFPAESIVPVQTRLVPFQLIGGNTMVIHQFWPI